MNRVISTLACRYLLLFWKASRFFILYCMKTYVWKTRVTSITSNVRGKLAVKIENVNWLQTVDPVVVLISIESKFHSEISGDLKMDALMSTIKSHVRGPITILLTERAHLSWASRFGFGGDRQMAEQHLCNLAERLRDRYERHFSGCQVVFWDTYICKDASYTHAKAFIEKLYKEDLLFREQLLNDVREPNDDAIQDLLEQCTCQLVLSSKGYRFQFYPGAPYASTEYVSSLLAPNKRVVWINVFLSIEKKQLIPYKRVVEGQESNRRR